MLSFLISVFMLFVSLGHLVDYTEKSNFIELYVIALIVFLIADKFIIKKQSLPLFSKLVIYF